MAKSGRKCKLYVNSATYATPTWVEIDIARDVNISLGKGENEANARDVDWEQFLPGLKTMEVTFDVRSEPTHTAWTTLRDAFIDDTELDIAVMDGDIATSGSKGYRAPMQCFGFQEAQPLEGTQTNSVTLKPMPSSDHAPAKFDTA